MKYEDFVYVDFNEKEKSQVLSTIEVVNRNTVNGPKICAKFTFISKKKPMYIPFAENVKVKIGDIFNINDLKIRYFRVHYYTICTKEYMVFNECSIALK